MAVLTTNARKHLKPSTFGLPGKKAYPMPDKAHAGNAKARVTHALATGKVTPAEAATVRHKANVILGETDSTYHNQPGK